MSISLLLRTLVLSVLLLSWINADLLAADMSRLIETGCTRCHKNILKKLEEVGSSHATAAECRDCHLTHPKQRGADFEVAECSVCHAPQDSKHYAIAGCRDCHHAHWPLEIDFAKLDKPADQACASCHDNPYQSGSTAHADSLRCTQCHTSHGTIPSCLECHKGHTQGTAKEPCLSCHQAHNPLPAIDAEGLTAKLCTACHAAAKAALQTAGGGHAQQACDDCHVQHKDKPDCLQCHQGHSEKMSAADCSSCHNHHVPLPALFGTETNSAFCVDCHQEVSDFFASSGGGHQQNLACADCHQNHPPADLQVAACSSCHARGEKKHYALEDCLQCHSPHKPISIDLDLSGVNNVLAACESCHAEVIAAMDLAPTAHKVDLSCTLCHEVHGESPSCLECHQGHDPQMQAADCSKCHHPHSPVPVSFAAELQPALCVGCHEQVVTNFDTSGKAHKAELSCTECHQQHPPAEQVVPVCADCHSADANPHFANAGCVDCHDPHQPIRNDIFELRGSRPVCAGCHPQVEEQLISQVSAHDRDCVGCHRRHIDVPSCLGCHTGHGEEMTRTDCIGCHQPHAPLQLSFAAEPKTSLCASCHTEVTEVIAAEGAAHRDQLSCSSCHQQHPDVGCSDCHSEHPQKGQSIPDSCFACHAPSSHPHFTVGDCLECHNPHQPLRLDLKKRQVLEPVCVSCHQLVADQFAEKPSGHSEQDCSACHSEHTKKRICLDCHDAHEKSMVQADCTLCHSPHQPQDIQLQKTAAIPAKFCASCHQEQAAALADKGAAHQQEFASCTACHPEHRPNGLTTIVDCGSCHSKSRRRHFTLENCAGCHDPHRPLELDLSKVGEVKPICVSCHNNQERLYKQYPNKHSEMDCAKCHPGQHGTLMTCQECHQPHLPKMTQVECLKCHPPHLPQVIRDKPGQVGAVCAACHEQAAESLKETGGLHKKKPCVSCHRSHPPHGKEVIPACVICHDPDDNEHFAVADCQQCHQAHQPLGHDLSKADNATAACVACHAEVAETFASFPSKHSEQSCNSCHPQHKMAQACSDCHQPHNAEMADVDCLSCHKSHHAPAQVTFVGSLPTGFCQACHQEQVDVLVSSAAKHNQLSCVDCHQGKHGSRLDCVSCHDQPHDPGLHSKYPDCLQCHSDPHDLADWRSAEESLEVVPEEQPVETDPIPAAPEAASSEDVK